MAIVQAVCNSFKMEVLVGTHDIQTDDIRIALFQSTAVLSQDTTVYDIAGEASGAGYTAGGIQLTGITRVIMNNVAVVDFDDVVWVNASITARGALIYNKTKANKAIAVYDFGEDKTSSEGDFTLAMPAATDTDAVIRVA